jgi:hypothetical protein
VGEDVLADLAPYDLAAKRPRRDMTLWLGAEPHAALKALAASQGVPVHDLLIDALNAAFAKQGLLPVA